METPPQVYVTVGYDADRLREQLVLLAVECPYTKSNPSGCPLHEVRKMQPTSIIDWLDGLTREEKDFVALYHHCCLVTKWECDWFEQSRRKPVSFK